MKVIWSKFPEIHAGRPTPVRGDLRRLESSAREPYRGAPDYLRWGCGAWYSFSFGEPRRLSPSHGLPSARGIVLRRSACPYFYYKIIKIYYKIYRLNFTKFHKNGKIAKKWERNEIDTGDRTDQYRTSDDFFSNFYDRVEATCGSLSREALLIRFQPPEGS